MTPEALPAATSGLAGELITAAVGLVGALVGALGVMWGSRLQTRHDKAQRERERVMALRRDVYLEAAEALAGYPQYLVGLANADVPVTSLEPLLTAKRGWQNKVHVIAAPETIAALARADNFFIRASLELGPLRWKIDELGRQVEEEALRESQHSQYQAALHAALQAELQHGQGAEAMARVQAIRTAIERSQDELRASYERKAALHGERGDRVKELLDLATRRATEHRTLLAEANLAVRRELDTPMEDDERYLAMIREMNDEVLAALDKLTQAIEADDEDANSG